MPYPRKVRLSGLLLAALISSPAVQADTSSPLIHEGQYIARAADCTACHTAPGGKMFAGGYAMASPLGQIYSTNITPSRRYGIGAWSEAAFARAVRAGVAADGHRLYPAMPYSDYAGMTDKDIHALYTYLQQAVPAVDTAPPQRTQLGFPFNQRPLMAVWNWLYLRQPDAALSADRGRYLVDVLGHCGSCHTPRTLLLGSDNRHYLAGADIAGWHAPNITSDPVAGIGGWSTQELVQFLRTGHVAGKAQAAGGMAEAVQNSLQYLSDADLQAMAVYLKSVPAQPVPGMHRPAYSYGQATTQAYDLDSPASRQTLDPATQAMPVGAALLASRTPQAVAQVTDGARLYVDACASCHQPAGSGTADQYYPSLYHNSTVGAAEPTNLVMTILQGVHRRGADGATLMPGFAADMNNQQVAAVANYVATRFGHPARQVDAKTVQQLRNGGAKAPLQKLLAWLSAVGLIVLLGLLALLGWRRRSR